MPQELYGLDEGERLTFDAISYQPLTRLIYHGFGLFQIQYMPWTNGTFNRRGSFTFFQVLFDIGYLKKGTTIINTLATWKRELKLPWREAGLPNYLDGTVDSDQ